MLIGLDLDGVIVNSIEYWRRVLNREAGTHYGPHDLPEPYSTREQAAAADAHELEMLIAPPPMAGAVAAISRLREAGHTLVVITARSRRLRRLTEAWLSYHGIKVDDMHFLQGADKTPLAKALGLDVMVEDTPVNAVSLAVAGIRVLLFAAPYNQGTGSRLDRIEFCDSWDDVIAAVSRASALGRAAGE